MKRILFFILMLLFAAILFTQHSFANHWWLHKHARGYPTEVEDIAWIDNSTFIIGGQDQDDNQGWLRKMNVNGEVLWGKAVSGGQGRVHAVSVPKNNPFFVVCGISRGGASDLLATFYTSDGSQRQLLQRFPQDGSNKNYVRTISNDKRERWGNYYFAVGIGNGWVDLWNLESQNNPVKVRNRDLVHGGGARRITHDIDWEYNLLIADGDDNVDKRDPDDFGLMEVFVSPAGSIVRAARRCGDYVVSGTHVGWIRIHDYYDDGRLTHGFDATNGSVLDIDVGPRTTFLAVASSAPSLRIWKFDSSAGRATSLKHTFLTENYIGRVNVAKFSPNGYWLAAGTENGTYIFKTDQSPAAPITETDEQESPPVETTLLSNFPNPFNPETWIPYQLAEPAEVTVTIHAADGKLVRTLALGQVPVGVYQDKDRAAYWDGKNEQGEPVASGVYFYTLSAGDFSATRKMLIRK